MPSGKNPNNPAPSAWTCRLAALAGTIALAVPAAGFGAGQWVVQDAALIEPRSCEVELWHSDFEDANFNNFMCRGTRPLQGHLEVEMPRKGREAFALEGKGLIREPARDSYGLGGFISAVHDTDTGRIEETLALGMVTVEPVADRLMMHLNLGALHLRDASDTRPFWGLGTELAVAGPLEIAAEAFADDRTDPTVRGGLRLVLFNDHLVIDTTFVEELESGGTSGWSAGIGFQALTF